VSCKCSCITRNKIKRKIAAFGCVRLCRRKLLFEGDYNVCPETFVSYPSYICLRYVAIACDAANARKTSALKFQATIPGVPRCSCSPHKTYQSPHVACKSCVVSCLRSKSSKACFPINLSSWGTPHTRPFEFVGPLVDLHRNLGKKPSTKSAGVLRPAPIRLTSYVTRPLYLP
jgi:hypothetical protein